MLAISRGELDYIIAIAVIVLIRLSARYIYAPIRIKKSQVKSLEPVFTPIEPSQMTPEAVTIFAQRADSLIEIGFELVGTAYDQAPLTGYKNYVSLWINRELKDSVQLIYIFKPSLLPRKSIQTDLVNFWTNFSDSTAIATSNNNTDSVFPPDSRKDVATVPGCQNIKSLHQFHRSRVARKQGNRYPELDPSEGAIARLTREDKDTYTRLVNEGYYHVDEQSKTYIPTLTGAFKMTWRLLFPWKQLMHWKKLRYTNAELKATGFGSLSRFRKLQADLPIANIVQPDSTTNH